MPFKSDAQRRWMYANHPAMAKRWQKETPKGDLPEKVSSYDDTMFSGDPTKLMPQLRQIHKLSEFPVGVEDLDAVKQPPGKIKSSQGFEYAETGPNIGEPRYEAPRKWRPGKIKQAAGLMGVSIPSMSEQYYMQGMGETGDEENMPIELVSMAGPAAAQGAQMVQMAKRLAQRPTQRMAQRHALREVDRAKIVQGLAKELELLKMQDLGLAKKPGLLSRILEKKAATMSGVPDIPIGDSLQPYPKKHRKLSPAERKKELWRFIQKVGPAAGTVGGAAWGIKKGLRGGELSSKILEGVGTGTLIGAVPAMMDEGVDAFKRLKEKTAYKLQGETEVQGIPIAIENRKGSVRTGTDSDGNEWRTKMKHPYGYIKGSKGVDGEPVDVYVGPDKEAPEAFVVHQHKDDGKGYDEDKVMLGFPNKVEAKKAYLAHYDDPKFLGPISRVSTERLKDLVASKKRLVKISRASYRAMLDELLAQGGG